MKKTVIIINGTGGAGKDTLCGLASKHYKVKNISAITPIKEIAGHYGWNGEKDSRARKFLSDLKKVFIDDNDMPTKYLHGEYKEFLEGEEELLFVHIREKEEIDKFKALVGEACVTLLVERERKGMKGYRDSWGNASDDEVKDYQYDYYYINNKPLPETEKDFVTLIEKIMQKKIGIS